MQKLKALILEDELKGLNNLKTLLQDNCPDVDVIGEAHNLQECALILANQADKIDLAFLDIHLPDGQVFEVLDRLKVIPFNIIFVTAYEEFAIKAFEYSSIGYIVKPIDPDKLVEAVQRAKDSQPEDRNQQYEILRNYYQPNGFEKMSIPAIDGIYFINIKDIIRCEAEDNYTHIHLKTGERITASKTIKHYEDFLVGLNFYRVHKSHLINLNFMKKFVKGDGGFLIMDDGIHIEVSRRRRPAFLERLKQLQRGL